MGENIVERVEWQTIEDAIYAGVDSMLDGTQAKARDIAKLLTGRVVTALAASPSPVVGDREAIGRVVAAWRAVNNEFGTYFVDEDGPYREVRDMDAAVESLSTPVVGGISKT